MPTNVCIIWFSNPLLLSCADLLCCPAGNSFCLVRLIPLDGEELSAPTLDIIDFRPCEDASRIDRSLLLSFVSSVGFRDSDRDFCDVAI